MKSKLKTWGTIICIAAFLISADAAAQRESRRSRATNSNRQQPVNTAPITAPGAHDNIPIIYDSASLFDQDEKPSLKPPHGFDTKDQGERRVLDYEHLRAADALYAQKVWRELDLREKMNQTFRYNATDNNGSQLFINILLSAVKNGKVEVFEDERFSKLVPKEQVTDLVQGKLDTVLRYSAEKLGVVEAKIVTRQAFDSRSVAKLLIMEEWIFDKESSRMHCRILGLAPLQTKFLPNGKPMGEKIMFWAYYPDLRPILANFEVYNPKNMGESRMTWEELFESRMFSSIIVKSSLNNPANLSIKQYIKDPILALLEGDNIREKIFNYEQDLWSY